MAGEDAVEAAEQVAEKRPAPKLPSENLKEAPFFGLLPRLGKDETSVCHPNR